MQARSFLVALALAAPLALGVMPHARGNDLEELVVGTLEQLCEGAPDPSQDGCNQGAGLGEGVFGGLERSGGGVSFADCTDDLECDVEVANFYFAPRYTLVKNGQEVSFTNVNPMGGNRHSVESSDWNSDSPVLPVPGANFGGGAAFKHALQPGASFSLTFDKLDLAPESVVYLPDGSAMVAYHCYIHGAAAMQAFIIIEA
jgi:plastocyanin